VVPVYHNRKLGLAQKLLSWHTISSGYALFFYFFWRREREKIIRPCCKRSQNSCVSASWSVLLRMPLRRWTSFQCGTALKLMLMRPYEYVQCIYCSCTIFHGRDAGVLLPAFAKHGMGLLEAAPLLPTSCPLSRNQECRPIRISNLLLDFVDIDWCYIQECFKSGVHSMV